MTTIAELRKLLAAAQVRERPWELYEAEGFTYSIFGCHPGEEYDEDLPCRITTGGDFDDVESARFAVAAVNALPALLDAADELEDLLLRYPDAERAPEAIAALEKLR